MAVLFEQTIAGKHYRVTRAGNSVRLYTDRLFHSQFNAKTILSGALWDLLLLPAFMAPRLPASALLLGVGGGAALKMLQHFKPDMRLAGVDINPVHIEIAKNYFGVCGEQVQLYCDDAKTWLSSSGSRRFDFIIDDLFGGADGDPQRPFDMDGNWVQQLIEKLTEQGVLAINLDRKSYVRAFIKQHSVMLVDLGIQAGWQLACPGYENRILILAKSSSSKSEFLQRLAHFPELDTNRQSCLLNFTLGRCYPTKSS